MNDERKLKDFDQDFGPEHPTNQEAARSRGLHWNPQKNRYMDSDGLPVRDQFGQPL